MSQWLDEHRDLLGLVARELVRVGVKDHRTARPACRSRLAQPCSNNIGS
jgi:hypothetical protein